MPRNIKNWVFKDVVSFLEQHFFMYSGHCVGSHYFYLGFVDGLERVVEVPYHSGKSIKPRTLKDSIAYKSGIPIKLSIG